MGSTELERAVEGAFRRGYAQAIIDERVESGELVRLPEGRIMTRTDIETMGGAPEVTDKITHKAFENGFMEQDAGNAYPLKLAGGEQWCARCENTFTPAAWSVTMWDEVVCLVCRDCAMADPELKPWQALCDATAAIDAAYQAAADEDQRGAFGFMLDDAVSHFYAWRE